MSMKPAPFPEPDPQVAAAVRAIWPRPDRAPLAVAVRDRLGGWLRDEDFAAAFGARGRPGYSPAALALVTVLQQAENLTGRLAAENARRALDWKYALGLPLDDGGFDFSVLSEFRARVAQGCLEAVALDALLGRLSADGLVSAKAWLVRELGGEDIAVPLDLNGKDPAIPALAVAPRHALTPAW